MTQTPHNQDWLERLMAEAAQAERAGVFQATEIEAASLLSRPAVRPSWFRRHQHALVGLPVAACLAFVAVLGTLHYGAPGTFTQVVINSPTGENNMTSDTSVAVGHRTADVLMSCFSGPGREFVSTECVTADFDSDGDVDLADFRAFQLAEAFGPIR
ncbi:MAG: hypothetical protein JXB13_05730 [Phycisphaerae bacterium]|nr:hypothetical protein [Phycisphaerae bacterium]